MNNNHNIQIKDKKWKKGSNKKQKYLDKRGCDCRCPGPLVSGHQARWPQNLRLRAEEKLS